jgi:hypothetical protein
MPDEAPAPPDRLDRAIAESHRLIDETKRLLDQARAGASGGESPATEDKGQQDGGSV